ncbi:S-methyl-5-thioribose-1-phosphate isomerase [bacterium]|nr:S-methyl-5-thioribose-1-phosphate isomerase [candidate division CSSED10-310 bacterium]
MVETLRWDGSILWILDQTRLPLDIRYEPCSTVDAVAGCIRNMLVRGAPAIGVTAGFGMVLAMKQGMADNVPDIRSWMHDKAKLLESTRPTAVNLAWATRTILDHLDRVLNTNDAMAQIESLASKIYNEDLQRCRRIGQYAAPLIPRKASILTHCNAGALATAGYGTALGVVRRAVEDGKQIRVFADETRPFLQGARLTAWELMQDNIDVTLITDSMAAHFMSLGDIDLVVVGADRIAANGDTANKIGTYSVALAAKAHGVPFYVAAPVNTIDSDCPDGSQIPIEERSIEEVTHIGDIRVAPVGIKVRNPAFDVTPNHLVSAIITDKGIVKADYRTSIAALTELCHPDDRSAPG